MAVKRGLDQLTAWVLSVIVAGACYGIGYGITKAVTRRAERLAALEAEEQPAAEKGGETAETAGKDRADNEPKRPSHEGEEPAAKEPAQAAAKAHEEHAATEAEAPEAKEHGDKSEKSSHEGHPEPKGERGGAEAAASVPWDYKGSTGPEHWGSLSEAFHTCADGKHQSPVDIDSVPTNQKLLPIRFHYKEGDAVLGNDGHTIAAQMQSGSYVEIDGDRYDIKEVHFHAPSEHKVAGVPYDFEAHLVHQDAEGHTAVIAVLYEEGSPNKSLARLWQALPDPGQKAPEPIAIDALTLLPERHLYYTYDGSLTTPPCTEGVKWLVLTEPLGIAPRQVDQFVRLVPFNARPVQALHGRHLQKSAR